MNLHVNELSSEANALLEKAIRNFSGSETNLSQISGQIKKALEGTGSIKPLEAQKIIDILEQKDSLLSIQKLLADNNCSTKPESDKPYHDILGFLKAYLPSKNLVYDDGHTMRLLRKHLNRSLLDDSPLVVTKNEAKAAHDILMGLDKKSFNTILYRMTKENDRYLNRYIKVLSKSDPKALHDFAARFANEMDVETSRLVISKLTSNAEADIERVYPATSDRIHIQYQDPNTGNKISEVTYHKFNGNLVGYRTKIGEDNIVSEIFEKDESKKYNRESWRFEDDLTNKNADLFSHVNSGNVQTTNTSNPQEFLDKLSELFGVKNDGVEYKLGDMFYEAKYHSSSMVSQGTGPDGKDVHVVSSLGLHDAFPFPGSHWDEAQIVILNEKHEKILGLRMPEQLESTHLAVSFRDEIGKDGKAQEIITYQGYMLDDNNKMRFVEADYVLNETDVTNKDATLWEQITGHIQKNVGFEQQAKLLSSLNIPASSLRVDGKEVLKIKSTLGALDDDAHFNMLAKSHLLALNYAPPQASLLSLIDMYEKEALYSYDATLLKDKHALLHKLIPWFVRKGLLAGQYIVDKTGEMRNVDDKRQIDGKPLSTKFYVWNFDERPIAVLKREIVKFRDEEGNIEYGFRETIYPYSKKFAYLLGPK